MEFGGPTANRPGRRLIVGRLDNLRRRRRRSWGRVKGRNSLGVPAPAPAIRDADRLNYDRRPHEHRPMTDPPAPAAPRSRLAAWIERWGPVLPLFVAEF